MHCQRSNSKDWIWCGGTLLNQQWNKSNALWSWVVHMDPPFFIYWAKSVRLTRRKQTDTIQCKTIQGWYHFAPIPSLFLRAGMLGIMMLGAWLWIGLAAPLGTVLGVGWGAQAMAQARLVWGGSRRGNNGWQNHHQQGSASSRNGELHFFFRKWQNAE